MAAQTDSTGTTAGAAGTQTQPAPGTGTSPANEGTDKTFTQADLNRMIAEEKRTWQRQMQDAAEQARLEAEGRHKELADRLKVDLDATQAKLRERDTRDAIAEAAAELKFSKPGKAHQLINPANVEYDAEGRPTNLPALLQGLLAEFPGLAATPAQTTPIPSGGATNPAKGGTTTFSRSQLRDPVFYQAHKEAILAAFREGRIRDE